MRIRESENLRVVKAWESENLHADQCYGKALTIRLRWPESALQVGRARKVDCLRKKEVGNGWQGGF